MRQRKGTCLALASLAAIGLLLPQTSRAQAAASPVGFWTVVTGGVTQDYSFTKDGRFESKLYGQSVYLVHRGAYSVQGDRLTLRLPGTAPETFRWRIVNEYGRPALKLTDSFGSTTSHNFERYDQRYAAGPLIPYEQASLVATWTVNHGGMHWEYAFTSDGRFQSKRIGKTINEIVRGTYVVKGNALVLVVPQKPLEGFVWRMERENGARTLILMDVYGAFEVYYEARAGG